MAELLATDATAATADQRTAVEKWLASKAGVII